MATFPAVALAVYLRTVCAQSDDSASTDTSGEEMQSRVIIAHGSMMAIAFVILFPLGALTIRLMRGGGSVWFHAGAQFFTYIVVLAGFGMGVWIAVTTDQLNDPHPIIGIIVTGLLLLQPVGGLVHHQLLVKHRRRTLWAVTHVWLGRSLLVLGIINGGLGLQLADNTTGGEIAYGVVAGVLFVLYVAVLIITQRHDAREGSAKWGSGSAKGAERRRSSDLTMETSERSESSIPHALV